MISSNNNLSPNQAKFVYWFNGLAPIATNIVTPAMVYYRVKKQPLTVLKRQEMVVQEVARQIVSGTIGILTYFGGGHLTKSLMEIFSKKQDQPMSEGTKQLGMIIGGTALSFFGYGFIRPMFSTDIILKWLGRQNAHQNLAKVGKLSSSKMLSLVGGFGAVIGIIDVLNRSTQPNKKQPEANPTKETSVNGFMQDVEHRSQFRGLA